MKEFQSEHVYINKLCFKMKCISYLWISDNNANISLVPDYFLLYLFVLLN